jgi:hypothetical protein
MKLKILLQVVFHFGKAGFLTLMRERVSSGVAQQREMTKYRSLDGQCASKMSTGSALNRMISCYLISSFRKLLVLHFED